MSHITETLTRSTAATTLRCLSEEEMARLRRERGAKIIQHRSRYWEQSPRGFYQPIHWLARLQATEAVRPNFFCWGYRSSLAEGALARANSQMPTHLAVKVDGYNMEYLPSKRRNQVRSCQRQVQIVEVMDGALLAEKAHEVYLSAVTRIGHGQNFNRDEYAAFIRREVQPDHRVVLAGLIDGEVGGYMAATLIAGTAYIDSVIIATERLPTNIGTGLVFEFMQICQRSGNVREVVYGLHTRENPSLCKFKEEMGFPVAMIPARIWMLPLMSSFIQHRRPHAHYRLFGK